MEWLLNYAAGSKDPLTNVMWPCLKSPVKSPAVLLRRSPNTRCKGRAPELADTIAERINKIILTALCKYCSHIINTIFPLSATPFRIARGMLNLAVRHPDLLGATRA